MDSWVVRAVGSNVMASISSESCTAACYQLSTSETLQPRWARRKPIDCGVTVQISYDTGTTKSAAAARNT